MKRIFFILAALLIAIVAWNRGSGHRTSSTETKVSEALARTNTSTLVRFTRSAEKTIEAPSSASTSEQASEDEDIPRLSLEQVEAYLLKTKRSAESLVNAFIETGDTNFLAEAAQRFPENPILQWTMAFNSSPEERSQWLEKLKISSPENGLPNYLMALDYLKSGNTDKALGEMDAAAGKKIDAFERARADSREEMYLLAGFSPVEAKEKGFNTCDISHLPEMKSLAWQIDELQKKYKTAGDEKSNQELAVLGIEAARKYSGKTNPLIINQLVGMAMEYIALKNLEPNTYYDFLGKTPTERFAEMKAQKQEAKDLSRDFAVIYSRLSDGEKTIYLNRCESHGELNALRWLNENYGTAPSGN